MYVGVPIVPAFAMRSPCSWLPNPSGVSVICEPATAQDVLGSSVLAVSAPESAFSKKPCLILWIIVFRNYYLNAGSLLPLGCHCSGPSQWAELRNICWHMHARVHTHISVSVFILSNLYVLKTSVHTDTSSSDSTPQGIYQLSPFLCLLRYVSVESCSC